MIDNSIIFITLTVSNVIAIGLRATCRDRSNHLRQDGVLCFEIPPWHYQPVELEYHVLNLKEKWSYNATFTDTRRQKIHQVLTNSEITRYMDTVLAPFLDTYHRNIQNAYQQLTSKILKKLKEEINGAVKKKQMIYKELIELANELEIPDMCEGERRSARTIASNHVAQIYSCTEDARSSITAMGKYAEEMIAITKRHMQVTVSKAAQTFNSINTRKTPKKVQIAACLKDLCRSAVSLGYELDLSLTNARRHNEQSCERLSACSTRARKRTEETVTDLRDSLYQCVYA